MALFLVRAGSDGDYENDFLDDSRIYLHWGNMFINQNITECGDYETIKASALEQRPDMNPKAVINGAGQINSFVYRIAVGDWVVLPRKLKSAISVGVVKSDYMFDPEAEADFRHYREVEWLNKDIPRSVFDQDLLFSFGAAMTICQIKRNNAESRVKALAAANWEPQGILGAVAAVPSGLDSDEPEQMPDLEQLARDQLAALIISRFAGKKMERLVEGIFKAQGYKTWRNPKEGADKSIDLLAAKGHLGFESPRICVQVKSQDTPLDRPTLDQLHGGMTRSKATHGLIVSWGGFKSTVDQEVPQQFFDVRLWDQQDLITQLLAVYDDLDEELRAELPLKRGVSSILCK